VRLGTVAGLPPLGLAAAVALGRALPVVVYALLSPRAPHLLPRIRPVDRVLREIEDLPGQAPHPASGSAMSMPAQRSCP
jgi:hypothetical protein